MPTELNTLFYPKSVAVIGASRSPEKLGSLILRNIKESGYTGILYPINPSADEIQGLKSYKSIVEVEQIPDLAVISIPAEFVIKSLTQIGEKGVKNVVVLSAGFKEIGGDGVKLENELVAVAKKYNINLMGPNCLGFVNSQAPINATFAENIKETGNLRFIAQSGALAASLFDYCNTIGLGISEFVTLGNKAGLTENDLLYYFHSEAQTSIAAAKGLSNTNPIGLYLESIADGAEFLKLVSEVTKKDPVLILKPGKSQAAAKAMQSHTGSIAGEDAVLDALLRQAGAVRCYTLEEFFDYSKAFAWENVPVGPKVAVISNAGGPAVISADAIIDAGLEFTQFDDSTKQKLSEVLPRSSSILNPVDVLGDALADRFKKAIEIVLNHNDVDSLVVILTPQLMTQPEKTAEIIGELAQKHNKPVFCSFIGGHAVDEGNNILNKYKIPSFAFPERAINAVGAMWRYRKAQLAILDKQDSTETLQDIKSETGTIRNIIQKAVTEGSRTLDNLDVDDIFKSVDINTPPTKKVVNFDEAHAFAKEVGWPVVLKLSAPGLLHKKDVGGVVIDILDEKSLENAWYQLEHKVEALDEALKKNVTFQIQKEILGGIEVIIGVRTDPTFGPVLLFGTGGAYSQIVEDKNIYKLPLDLNDAQQIVKKSIIYKLLKGHDGDLTYALDKLYDLIVKVGSLGQLIPEATDIEINPVIVTLNDVWAVDGKVMLKDSVKPKPKAPVLKEAICTKHEVLATKFNYFEVETPEPFDFKAGQYISVKVAPTAIRAYSIATRLGPNKFALMVDTRPGGPGSLFFENLKVGEKIPFLGPFGVFTLKPDDGSNHMVFLATGSGITAVRCMIDDALQEMAITTPITLYFGLTHTEEVFWKDHFDTLAQNHPNFKYEIVLFEPDETWSGEKGYNTELVKKNFAEMSNCSVYLCGHPAMIAGATRIVGGLECPENRIYSERFA